MKKVCILIGRKIQDNLNRELTLMKELNNYDIECTYLIPEKIYLIHIMKKVI